MSPPPLRHRTTAVPACLGLQGCIAVLSALWAPTGSAAPQGAPAHLPTVGMLLWGRERQKETFRQRIAQPWHRSTLQPSVLLSAPGPQLARLCTGRPRGSQRHSGHKAVLLPRIAPCTAGNGLFAPWELVGPVPADPPSQLRANSRTFTSIPRSSPAKLGVPHPPLLPECLSAHADLLPQTELGMTRAAPTVLVPAPAADTRSVLSGFNPAVSLLTPHAPCPCAGTSIPTLTA